MNNCRFFLAAILATTFAHMASAQQADSLPDASAAVSKRAAAASAVDADVKTPKRSRGGWTIAGFFGASHTSASNLTISQPSIGTNVTFANVKLESKSFKSPQYYGFRGSYFFPRRAWLGIEAEFIHLKVFSDPQQPVHASGVYRGAAINRDMALGNIVQRYSISHGVNLLLLSAVARYQIGRTDEHPDGRFIFSARAGGGPTLPHTESTIDNQAQEQYQTGRGAWQVAAGVEYRILGQLYALAEYKFTRTHQRGRIFSGTAESLLRSQHGIFGLNYHFNRSTAGKSQESSGDGKGSRANSNQIQSRFDFFGGYQLVRARYEGLQNLHAWNAVLTMRSRRWLSFRLGVSGAFGATSANQQRRHSVFIGPQFNVYSKRRANIFLAAQLGAIRDVVSSKTEARRSLARSSVIEAGGGVDLHLTPSLSYRVEFLPNLKPKDWQNDTRLTTGLVFHFRRHRP